MASSNQPDDRREIFDDWASGYDEDVGDIAKAGGFPFAGYEAVLATMAAEVGHAPGGRVLDLGTGTGELARRLLDAGHAVTAADSSPPMLEKAREKVPQATLVEADLLADVWPDAIDGPFDAITSAYVLHEFTLPHKIDILKRCADRLAPGGRIVIGDVAFPTRAALDAAHERWRDRWDDDEHYWAADEALDSAGSAGLAGTWREVSACAGVLVFKKPAQPPAQ